MNPAQDDLDREIAEIDRMHSAPPAGEVGAPPEPQPVQIDEAGQIAGVLTLLAGMGAPMFPSIGKIYTEQTIAGIAQALAPVFKKHGWSTAGMFGKYAEEIAAASVILPVAWATYTGIRQDIAAANAKVVEQPQAEAEPAPVA